MSTSLVVRFADRVSPTQTTHERLKAVADHLGVSQNKAVHMAINALHEHIEDDIAMAEEFRLHGRKVGGVTYLNADEAFIRRVEDRIARGVPLPQEDDESLERHLLFTLLSEEEQAQVKAAADPMQKRHLIARFIDRKA